MVGTTCDFLMKLPEAADEADECLLRPFSSIIALRVPFFSFLAFDMKASGPSSN